MTPEQFQLLLILLFNPILNFVLSILSNKISERFHLRIRSAWIWLLSIASCLLLAYITLQDEKYQKYEKYQEFSKWLSYILIFLILIFLLDCLYLLIFKPKPELPSKITPREGLIKQVYTEVNSRLEQSLHNRVYILLEEEQNISQVETPWEIEIKAGDKPKTRLKNTKITTVFDQPDIAGRLLILGQPGAGKTTMLLKLAEELVKRANDDPVYPIPVLFSLPTWKKDNQNIKDWLIQQLKDKYGVRTDIGKQWVQNQEIIPLLDGLDELAAERQEACVKKINDFLHPGSWNNPIIVCSRIEEYGNYTTLLRLNNSIELCPFTNEQVNQYLCNTGNAQLWDSISNDTELSQLAKTPLLLNIIVLCAEEIYEEKWQHFQSKEERFSYLFDVYILRMLKRPYKGKQPKTENTQRWLGWLAQQLIEKNATEFLIEKIQPYWLKKKFQIVVYNLIVWGIIGCLITGLINGLINGLIPGLINGLINGPIPGSISGLINGPIPGSISGLINWRNWSHSQSLSSRLISGLISGLIYGLIGGLITGLVYGLFGKIIEDIIERKITLINPLEKKLNKKIIKGLIIGLIGELIIDLIEGPGGGVIIWVIIWVIYGLMNGLFLGLIGDEVQTIETIKFSLNKSLNGLIVGLTVGLIVGLGLVNWQISWLIRGAVNWQSLGLIGGLIGGLIVGIDGLEVENKTIPNQGIRQSVINTAIVSAVVGLVTTLLIFVIKFIIIKNEQQSLNIEQALIFSLILGAYFGIVIAVPRSGTPAIKHFILRIILWYNGYIPWNYAKFLNYGTNRLFLQRVGGSYRFIHDLLRQHFAKTYIKPSKN